jgi:hypothetical protein
MVSISYGGRLGNNFFQYCAAYIFAKKFNLNLTTPPIYNVFNLPKLEGNSFDNQTIEINNNNFLDLLKLDKIENAHYVFNDYFQLKAFILEYYNEIKSIFTLNKNEVNKDLVFVNYRIGDIINTQHMLPIEYYVKSLNKLKFNGGFITSDTLNHPNISYLAEYFNLQIYYDDPNNTINFAKDFNNLVLSEGTFSWWIGFLSNAENIIYCDRPKLWHGDIFVLPNWEGLKF